MTPCRQPTETDPATGQTAFAQDFGHNQYYQIHSQVHPNFSGVIGRSVIDKNHFQWLIRLSFHRFNTASYIFSYVINRYNNANKRILLSAIII